MAAKKISSFEILNDLEYVLEVLAKNYVGEAKTELASLIISIDSSDLPPDLLLKVQCGLIEVRDSARTGDSVPVSGAPCCPRPANIPAPPMHPTYEFGLP